jgi:predicted  nucleic acid-binding Zn-ribbon protein
MAQLHLFVKDQTLTIKSDIDKVVENSENYLKADVTLLDEYWEDLDLSLLVEYDGSTYPCGEGSGYRTYIVNSSYIQPPGFFLTLVGRGEEIQIPTNSIFVPVHLSNSLVPDEELIDPPERWDSAIDGFNTTISEFKETVNGTINEFEETVNKFKATVEDKIKGLGGRVTTNEGNISDLQTNVETTKGNLSTFIGQTENNISELGGRIDTIEGQELNERITTNEGNISNLQTNVETTKNKLFSTDILQLHQRETQNAFIGLNKKWIKVDSPDYEFVLMPIKKGDVVNITVADEREEKKPSGSIALLNGLPEIKENGSVNFVEDSYWQERKDIIGEHTYSSLPDDAQYLYVSLVYNGIEVPLTRLEINGYDYLLSAKDNIQKTIDALSSVSVVEEITNQSNNDELPTAKAVKEYTDAIKEYTDNEMSNLEGQVKKYTDNEISNLEERIKILEEMGIADPELTQDYEQAFELLGDISPEEGE